MSKDNKLVLFLIRITENNFVLSCLLCMIFYFIILIAFPIIFEARDDSTLIGAFSGWTSGVPKQIYSWTSPLLGIIISSLYTILPTLPWYTFFKFFVMYTSTVAMLYVILSECSKNNVSFALRVLISTVFLCVFLLYSTVHLQFTVTAAYAIAASVVLFYFYKPKTYTHNIVFIFAIIFFYLIGTIYRSQLSSLGLAFLFCVFVYKTLYHKNHFKMHFIILFICLSIYLLLPIFNTQFRIANGWGDYFEYNVYRVPFQDYPRPSYNENPEIYHAAGWSIMDYQLISSARVYIAPNYNLDALSIINELVSEQIVNENLNTRIINVYSLLVNRIFGDPQNRQIYIALVSIWLSTIVVAALRKWKICSDESEPDAPLAKVSFMRNNRLLLTIGIIVLFHILLVYTLDQGRFRDHAYRSIILVFAPISLSNLLHLLYKDKVLSLKRKIQILTNVIHIYKDKEYEYTTESNSYSQIRLSFTIKTICALLLALSLFFSYNSFMFIDRNVNESVIYRNNDIRVAVETLVNENPENLYVADDSHVLANPFTILSEGRLTNYIRYGASFPYTPYWYASVQASGRDTLLLENFWDTDVFLISRNPNRHLVEYFKRENPDAYFQVVEELPRGLFVFSLVNLGNGN